jgi:hypothetical protein
MEGRRRVRGRARANQSRGGIGATWVVVAIALLAWGATGWTSSPPGATACTEALDAATPRVSHGVHAEVLFAPTAVRLPDRTELVYELHLTSFAREPVTLDGLRVVDAATGGSLLELCPEELGAVAAVQGAASMGGPAGGVAPSVAAGARAVVYLHVPVPPSSRPDALRHRIVLGSANGAPVAVETEPVEVSDRRAPVLGPPLRGGPWVAVYAPGMERGHRRVVYAVDGRARIPGRFAIDWMRPDGVEEPPAPSNDVLAVADAVVAAARDDFPADAASPTGAAPVLDDASGNYVALDLGDGTYVFYEHLAPGVLVRPGDHVQRGQVIGKLGATGSVTRPHVHLHVADGPSPLAAEGLPWTLTDMEILGAYPSIDAFREGGRWSGDGARAGQSEPFHPAPNMVVRFPDGVGE